jgi:hypothetical protein
MISTWTRRGWAVRFRKESHARFKSGLSEYALIRVPGCEQCFELRIGGPQAIRHHLATRWRPDEVSNNHGNGLAVYSESGHEGVIELHPRIGGG